MSSIYLTPASISFLTQFILALVITFFLARRREKMTAPQVLLASFFATVTIFIGLLFLDAALSPFPRLLAVYAENTILALALVLILQFAYHFPCLYSHRKWEAYASLAASGVYLFWEGQFMVNRYIALLERGSVLYRSPGYDRALALVFVWVVFAFLRQIVDADPRAVNWMVKLWKPEGAEARGARSFVLTFTVLFVLSLVNIWRSFSIVSTTFYNTSLSIGILIAMWTFASSYINHIPGGSSVLAKLSLLVLTLYMALLGLVGWVIAPSHIKTYRPHLTDHQTLRFIPDASGGYDVTEVDFSFETALGDRVEVNPFSENRYHKINYTFPFYGQTHTEVYAANSGVISMGELFYQPNMQNCCARFPAIFPLMIELNTLSDGGLYVRVDADTGRLIVTWDHLPAVYRPEAIFTFQVVLYRDGVFDITYNGLPLPFTFDPDATPSANPWLRGVIPGQGESLHASVAPLTWPRPEGQLAIIENFQLDFRRYLHEFIRPLTWVMIGGSISLLLLLPQLLRLSLVNPLNALTAGVRQMEAGDLNVAIPIQYQDEIGYLTNAFNLMVVRLRELVTDLEERFRRFFEYEPDYCFIISQEGVILDANPAALNILGYSLEDLVGKPRDIIFAPESRATAQQLWKNWKENGELLNEELDIISKAGERRTVLLSSGSVRDREGNLLYSLSIHRDITERKRAEKAMLDLATFQERRRIASDLHDSMTQSLHSLILSAETAQLLHRENRREKLAASLAMLEDSARQALQEMRLLCYELQLTPEEHVDLFEILNARLGSVERRLGMTTELNIENRGVIPKAWEKEFFFIITEALNNTLKHSQADHISVSVHGTPYRIVVKVSDNGRGFDPDQIPSGGMGLRNVAERIERLGGVLTIDSAPGAGATITMQIDLDETRPARSEE